MKLRIIQRGDGKFLVQEKVGLFTWSNTHTFHRDYPAHEDLEWSQWINSVEYHDHVYGVFSSLELAERKILSLQKSKLKLIEEERKEKLKNKFKVIEEYVV